MMFDSEVFKMACEHNVAMECPCTYACKNNGKCCACIAAHAPRGQFPACFYSKEAEKSYDRSYAALLEDRK